MEALAVNTRLLLKKGLEGIGKVSHFLLRTMTKKHDDINFYFLFDRPYDKRFIYANNISPLIVHPPARHPFLFITWFEFRLPAVLRRYPVKLFFSPDGYLSLRLAKRGLPQFPLFHDLAFLRYPEHLRKADLWHYTQFFPKYAQIAEHIFCVSQHTKKDIIEFYKIKEEKITVVYPGPTLTPKSNSNPDVKKRFSQGKPYFLFVSAVHPRKNTNGLLKAFDLFKERTKADVNLLIVGRKAWKFERAISYFKQMKHRDSVHFTGYVSETMLCNLYQNALGLCYVSFYEGFGLPILEAFQCGCPVIYSDCSAMPEVAADAGIAINPHEPESIAVAMQQLYENPSLRETLIEKGKKRLHQFSWEKTEAKVWEILKQAL